jgi:hypothetical protein
MPKECVLMNQIAALEIMLEGYLEPDIKEELTAYLESLRNELNDLLCAFA